MNIKNNDILEELHMIHGVSGIILQEILFYRRLQKSHILHVAFIYLCMVFQANIHLKYEIEEWFTIFVMNYQNK